MDLVKTQDRSSQLQKHAIYDLSTSGPAPSCCRLARLFTAVNVAQNAELRGRAFELAVGAKLVQQPGQVFYWRERNDEVDFA